MFRWGGGEPKKETKPLISPPPSHPASKSSKLVSVEGWRKKNCTFMVFLPAWPASPGPAPSPALPQLRAPWRKAAQSPCLPLPAGHRASKRALSSGGGEASGPLEKNNSAPNSC